MDLGDTAIENIFINDYMPMASGTFVKVYLLGFKYARDKDDSIEVNNRVIAQHLQIPLEDVLAAWDFWEKKGIIVKIPFGGEKYEYGVEFKSLKQLYIRNNFKVLNRPEEKKEITSNDVIDANQNAMINKMFNSINTLIRRESTITEKMEILRWIQEYNMNPDVIEFAFKYAVEDRNIRYNHIKYVNAIVVNWYDRKLTNMPAIMEDFKNTNQRYYDYREIMKHIGLAGMITPDMKNKMNKWIDDYKFSMDLILECCKKSSGTTNPNINYIDKIMADWYEKGIKTVEDLEVLDKKPEDSAGTKTYNKSKNNNYKNRFHNFKQQSDDYTEKELEDLFERKREKYFEKFKGE